MAQLQEQVAARERSNVECVNRDQVGPGPGAPRETYTRRLSSRLPSTHAAAVTHTGRGISHQGEGAAAQDAARTAATAEAPAAPCGILRCDGLESCFLRCCTLALVADAAMSVVYAVVALSMLTAIVLRRPSGFAHHHLN